MGRPSGRPFSLLGVMRALPLWRESTTPNAGGGAAAWGLALPRADR